MVVKARAFLPVPDPDTGTIETSVTDTEGLSENEIWPHLDAYVRSARSDSPRMHGRADVTDIAIRTARVQTRYDDGPARHVAIVGWPPDKEQRKAIAVELASVATLALAPEA